VKATLRLARRTTYADYLAAEHTSERRHEFIDGVIVAMAGDSDERNAPRNERNFRRRMRLEARRAARTAEIPESNRRPARYANS
jgi:hypothetical protein